ncbi:MAG: TOBE domain-containing protein, partial [candidate division WOR-3 bacterium]
LQPVLDKPATLGIRPEALRIAPDGELGAVVEVAELMGNEVILYLRAGSDSLIARVPPDSPPRPGDSLRLKLDPDRLHFFDPATELRLT